MSQALALASAFFYGIGDFAGGYATKRVSVWRVIAWAQLLGLGLLAIGVLVVAGLAGLAGLVLLYLSLARGTMAIVAPISGAVAAAVPVVFDLIGGTGFTARQGLGVALALGAILMVGLGHDATQIDRRSLLGGVIAGAMFGVFFIALAQTDAASGLWPLVAARATTIPVAFAIAAYRGVAGPPRSGDLGIVVVAGTFDMAANIAGALALQRGPVGVTSVLVSLYPAVTAITAIVVLHERPTGRQIAGIVLALAALIALIG